MTSQNLFDLILSDAPIDPQPTAQYQVTTSIVSTPRASDDNILPEPNPTDANDNNEIKPSWDLTAFEVPQPPLVPQTGSSEKQQAADDLSDFFGTPVPASTSTPQQQNSPNPQHSPQKKHVNDDFFETFNAQSPKKDIPRAQEIKKEEKAVEEVPEVKEIPREKKIPKNLDSQYVFSGEGTSHIKGNPKDNKPGNNNNSVGNDLLNRIAKELDEQHANNKKKILAMLKDNVAQTNDTGTYKNSRSVDPNQLERRLKELEEQNKQLVTAVQNLQSQNKTLTTRLSKYEDVSQLETGGGLGSKIIGFFKGK